MYEEYYGFVQPPFSLTPDPRFLYRSESHDVALQQVWQAIRRKEGFIVLTGDIGTGKTTLCRTVLEQFDPTTFTALILNPFLSVEELLREVLLSFGVASKDALRTGRLATASKHELIRTLHDFLLSLVPLHGSAVLIIDEAQHLSTDVLEEIRILSNLETNEQKLLQIVLVGQLNLLDVLHDAKLRQLDQRISIRCLLKPLNREEVEAYITHRLWVARGSTAVTFLPDAINLVHALSQGVPRRINLVCDRALMAGCQAQTDRIGAPLILEAASALDISVPRSVQRRDAVRRAVGRTWRVAALVLLLVAAALVLYLVFTVGNPLELLQANEVQPPRPAQGLEVPLAATPPSPPETMPVLTPPPQGASGYSVFVGAFDGPRDAARVEAVLRARNLPVYAIDLRSEDGSMRRRLFVGRFASRQEAEAAHQQVASVFPSARVTTPAQERIP
jgi:general secretion pathway protein A